MVKSVYLCRVDYCTLYARLVLVAEALTGPPAYPETVRECRDFVLKYLLLR